MPWQSCTGISRLIQLCVQRRERYDLSRKQSGKPDCDQPKPSKKVFNGDRTYCWGGMPSVASLEQNVSKYPSVVSMAPRIAVVKSPQHTSATPVMKQALKGR